MTDTPDLRKGPSPEKLGDVSGLDDYDIHKDMSEPTDGPARGPVAHTDPRWVMETDPRRR